MAGNHIIKSFFFLSLLLSTSLGGRSHHVEGYFKTKFVSLSTSKAITASKKRVGLTRTSLEPTPLTFVDRRSGKELLLGAVLVGKFDLDVLTGLKVLEVKDGNLVGTGNLVIVGRVLEPERKHTLLLQVGLVDTGKGSANDSSSTKESGLKSGMFSGRAFTIVLVTDNDPRDISVSVVRGNSGDSTVLASLLVENLVGLAIVSVDGTDQTVF